MSDAPSAAPPPPAAPPPAAPPHPFEALHHTLGFLRKPWPEAEKWWSPDSDHTSYPRFVQAQLSLANLEALYRLEQLLFGALNDLYEGGEQTRQLVLSLHQQGHKNQAGLLKALKALRPSAATASASGPTNPLPTEAPDERTDDEPTEG